MESQSKPSSLSIRLNSEPNVTTNVLARASMSRLKASTVVLSNSRIKYAPIIWIAINKIKIKVRAILKFTD